MQVIYLVRHAESKYTPDEYGRGLTKKGKQDAEKVAQTFKFKNIDAVISSPYRRAIETVAGIAEHKNLKLNLVENFRERSLASESVPDFESAVKAVWNDPDFSHPGGESNKQATLRGVNAINQVLEKYPDKSRIVIGTHGNLMALIMQHFNPRYDYHFWKNELKMPDIYGLTFSNLECLEIFHVPIDNKSTNNIEK